MGLVDSLLLQLVISNIPVFQCHRLQYVQICLCVYVYKVTLSWMKHIM